MMKKIIPRKRHKQEFKHIETLKGMSLQDQADFCYADMKRFFKILLWDRSKICAGCLKSIRSLEKATLDHIVPKSKGGHTRLANVQLMHKHCNGSKTNKMPLHYSHKAFKPTDSSRGSMIKEGIL